MPWQYPGAVTDTNGNSISVSTSSGTTTYTDTLGATALKISGSGTSSSPIDYTYTGWSGQASVQANYSSYTVQTNFGCSGIVEYGPTQAYLVSSITLPDSSSYGFTYETTPGHSPNITGRLASVTLPTGGTISYQYSGGSQGVNCGDASTPTLTRTVTPGGSGTPGTWTYVHTENSPTSTTTITDPNSNDTIISFYGASAYANAYEQERKASNSSGTLMETVDTCYNGASIPCVGTAVTLPITSLTVQTTLPSFSPSQTSTTYNTHGLPTETDEYNFGPSLVRKTILSYSSCGVTNGHVVDRPCSVTIENPSGGTAASTTYSYDANGNRLSESRSTGGTPATVSRSFTYTSNGVVQTATDFNGNTTTYSSFTCGANNNSAFAQTISLPLSLSRSVAWNCNVALPSSTTDENSQTTTYTYDNMLRLTNTSYPDGGAVSTTYTSATVRDIYTNLFGTTQRHDQLDLDGMGRTSISSLVNDPEGQTYVTTSYDSAGRTLTVTNPYRTTSTGSDTYSYDALYRMTEIEHADSIPWA